MSLNDQPDKTQSEGILVEPGVSPLSPLDSFSITHESLWRDKFAIRPTGTGPAKHAFVYKLHRRRSWSRHLKQSVTIHAGPDRLSPAMATIDFQTMGKDANIVIGGDPAISSAPPTEVFFGQHHGGLLKRTNHFTAPTGAAGDGKGGAAEPEEFEWRHSHGDEVQALGGVSDGYKLVRIATDEVVAVLAGKSRWPKDKEWMFAFRGSGLTSFDGTWRSIAATTAVALWDILKRERDAAAGGAAS